MYAYVLSLIYTDVERDLSFLCWDRGRCVVDYGSLRHLRTTIYVTLPPQQQRWCTVLGNDTLSDFGHHPLPSWPRAESRGITLYTVVCRENAH